MASLFCPFADGESFACQRKNCAMAVANTQEGEAVWTCGLVHPGAGDPIIIGHGKGPHKTLGTKGGQRCRP